MSEYQQNRLAKWLPTRMEESYYEERRRRLIKTLNAARVMRWHTQPDGKQQTVGGHTFGVMCILLEVLTQSERGSDILAAARKSRADTVALLVGALLHDAHEAYLGDIPAPVVARLKGSDDFVEMESRARDKVMWVNLTPADERIIFYADKIEAMLFALHSGRTEAFEYNRDLVIHEFANDTTTPPEVLDAFKRFVAPYDFLH